MAPGSSGPGSHRWNASDGLFEHRFLLAGLHGLLLPRQPPITRMLTHTCANMTHKPKHADQCIVRVRALGGSDTRVHTCTQGARMHAHSGMPLSIHSPSLSEPTLRQEPERRKHISQTAFQVALQFCVTSVQPVGDPRSWEGAREFLQTSCVWRRLLFSVVVSSPWAPGAGR